MQPSLDESALLEQNSMYAYANTLLRFTQLAGEPKVDRNADSHQRKTKNSDESEAALEAAGGTLYYNLMSLAHCKVMGIITDILMESYLECGL